MKNAQDAKIDAIAKSYAIDRHWYASADECEAATRRLASEHCDSHQIAQGIARGRKTCKDPAYQE